jgi:addiction module HigA family antidote
MRTTFRVPANKPTSVGEMLKVEFLEPLKITQGQLAKAMCVGRKTVNELCVNKRGVSSETAFLLAKVLGTTPEFWINLQIINDLWSTQHSELMQEKLKMATVLVEMEAA